MKVTPIHRLLLLTGLLSIAAPHASAGLAEDLATQLDAVKPSHPRLFVSADAMPALKAKISNDSVLSAVYAHLIASADATMDMEPVKRIKEGKRLLSVCRACLQRVSYLAFAFRMTEQEKYLKRAEQEMLAAAAFEDWNPSHFLDVAEMTAALAVGYDWLYDGLDPASRDTIRDAIVKLGLETSMKGGGWVTTTNNWNQVCHGGLVLGALAILEHNPDLAKSIIARAIENVPHAMAEYAPDGVYPEGPSYWEYGTTYNVIMLSALESVLGSDFGLASAEGFLKTPEFYLHATGPAGLFFNYSDCGTRGGISPAMHWFARQCHNPGLLWREKIELGAFSAEKPEAGGDRMLPFLLIWASPIADLEPPKKLCWKGDGRTPVAMFRTAWREDATYLAVKGGSPSTNHAHMDTGSFVVDMKGVRWAVDLGSQGYHSLESRGIDLWNKKQDSERWTVFRLNNLSHNTLVVDGQFQRVDGKGLISRFSDSREKPFAIVDMTPVYDGQLKRAVRGVRLIGESVLVQDEIATLDRVTNVRWAMATHAEVAVDKPNEATLRQDGQSISFRILSPADTSISVLDVEKPPHDYDAANPNTRMITFELPLAPSTEHTWAVLLTSDPSLDASPLNRLDEW